jgi:hypothetical protein
MSQSMGYDCTLHAVDEKEISRAFEAYLQRAQRGEETEDSEEQELWDQVGESLDEGSAEEAASLICQLALVLASKSQPYHYERGFALCLWPKQPAGMKARFPEELTDSPETLFGGMIAKHPELRGHFPREFTGNWSTGTFISPAKVPEALLWVENKVAGFAEGDKWLFRGLLLVLSIRVSKAV